MAFELTKDFIVGIEQAIQASNREYIEGCLESLHVADIAEILHELDKDEAKIVLEISGDKASEVLTYLNEDERIALLELFTSQEIADKLVSGIDTDDAADILGELPDKKKEEVLSLLEDAEQASDIVDLLHYTEGTAGALMAKELMAVNENWSVLRSVREMRKQAEDVTHVYTIYVVDDKDNLVGLLSLKTLLYASDATKISALVKKEGIISVKTNTPAADVGKIMEKYDLVVIPVVDDLGRLQGRITVDDIMDVIREEAEKDYQMASGHTMVVEARDSVYMLTRARLPWLVVGLIGGIFGSRVIGLYEHEIQIHPEMAFFIPLIAATAGNVGVQSSAIIVQTLASDRKSLESMVKKLWKEFYVALLNGLVCASLIFLYSFFFEDNFSLSLTVSISLLAVILFAGLFGTFIPLVLDKYKIDPAIATGPFITTSNDIVGLLLYFFVGRLMYAI